MKKIVKISENTYLVNGAYLTHSFNEAVFKANRDSVMPTFNLDSMKLSLWDKVICYFNMVLDMFEVVDQDNYV